MAKAKRKPKVKPEQPDLATLEARVTRLEQVVGLLIRDEPPVVQGRQEPDATAVYMSGRWHRRDGNAYGKPPYYADHQARRLRPPDKR